MSSPHRASALVARILACLLPTLALAPAAFATEDVCVNTSAELRNALLLAESDDVVIRLVQGVYHLDDNPLDLIDDQAFGYTITLIGGYNATCTSRSVDPHLTTITGDAERVVIRTYDSLFIDSIRFASLPGGVFLTAFSYTGNGPDEQIVLRRVIFDDLCTSGSCGGDGYPDIAVSLDSDEVSASHLLVTRNGHGSCALEIDTYDLDDAYLSYSVIAGNAGDGLCMTRSNGDPDYRLHAQNNIFDDNGGGQDIRTRRSPNINLRNNIYHVLDASPAPASAPIATINADPQFVAPASGNFRLLTGSPAINSGTPLVSNPLWQDLDGGPRMIGSAPDRGAYETNVDDTNIITVTNTADQVAPLISGSLRWAIALANANDGLDHIRFDIPGACPRIINLVAPLPQITERVIVEGYTQPGSAPNTSPISFSADICIGIRGDLSDDYAFRIPAGVGTAHYLQLSGVALGGFDQAAVDLQGGAGSWIHGVQFGGSLGGTALGNNARNVRISGNTTYYNLIGGEDRADRNLIAWAYTHGISLLATHANGSTVRNNYIGTTASGTAAAPNDIGIEVTGSHHVIRDNLISGNQTVGIRLNGSGAHDNFIAANRIGLRSFVLCVPSCGPAALPNISHGIHATNGAHDNDINVNTIAWNGGAGVRLSSGLRNSLLTNSIHDNDGLGIDLNLTGVDAIDNDAAADADARANRGINYPAMSLAIGTSHVGSVRTMLVSTNGDYIVQAFTNASCDASGYGEGATFAGSALATIDNAGSGNGSVIVDVPVTGTLVGRQLTLVARDAAGNSSEFSNCVPYHCDVIFAYGLDGSSADTCPAE